jgi:hypothetical protein
MQKSTQVDPKRRKEISMSVKSVLIHSGQNAVWTSGSLPVHWRHFYQSKVMLNFQEKGVWHLVDPSLRGAIAGQIFENTFGEAEVDVDQEVANEIAATKALNLAVHAAAVIRINTTFPGAGNNMVTKRTELLFNAADELQRANLHVDSNRGRLVKQFADAKERRLLHLLKFKKDSELCLSAFRELFETLVLTPFQPDLLLGKFRKVLINLIDANSGTTSGSQQLGALTQMILSLSYDQSLSLTNNLQALESLFDQCNEIEVGHITEGSKLVHFQNFIKNGNAHGDLKHVSKNLCMLNDAVTYTVLKSRLLITFSTLVSEQKISLAIGESSNLVYSHGRKFKPDLSKPKSPICPGCFNAHPGVCRLKNIICEKCGKKGHKGNKCPSAKAKAGNANNSAAVNAGNDGSLVNGVKSTMNGIMKN